ncbi:sterol desaturase family protein [Williamsia sp. 1135]|uniref:sterol desaturase family protein n=1 Tax=Williamsia sp. 1135 TaxID=1889262 RepID=UPI000A10173D|nr:sterol desaturase family protein [Williamsia sp. 1135]ORM34371.1 fatty acid hydroxylase [Williamsia sp. 1135]
MTTDRDARAHLRADERTLRKQRRTVTLGSAFREFVRHPTPWMIVAFLAGSAAARVSVGDWAWTDVLVPVVMILSFPLAEWLIHVFILHWRPKVLGRITVDSLLSRKHREHHSDPRDIPLIFIPWQVLCGVLPLALVLGLFAFGRVGLGLTFMVTLGVLGMIYEWTHYLIHTDYKPKSKLSKATWRHHRFHHYKNEHYWFTVTTSGTADRVLRTNPDPESVEKSPTAKNLHAL